MIHDWDLDFATWAVSVTRNLLNFCWLRWRCRDSQIEPTKNQKNQKKRGWFIRLVTLSHTLDQGSWSAGIESRTGPIFTIFPRTALCRRKSEAWLSCASASHAITNHECAKQRLCPSNPERRFSPSHTFLAILASHSLIPLSPFNHLRTGIHLPATSSHLCSFTATVALLEYRTP